MKKMWLILIFLFFVGAGALFVQFNEHKSQDLMWEKWNYPYLDEVNNPRDFEVSGYQFLKISDQEIGMMNRVFLYPESEWYSSELSDDPLFWTQESMILYNRDMDLFSVGLEYGSASWIFFNSEGEIIEHIKEEDQPNGNHQSWEMVGGQSNYYRFDDQVADIYVAYFAKQRYNWSRHNPLANIGSPTAGHGTYWWWFGNAFIKLRLEKGTFIFKTDGQMDGINSDAPQYKVMIDYYKIPKEYTGGKETVLIYQAKSFENMSNGLFMIKEN